MKNILILLIIVALVGTGIYFWQNKKSTGTKTRQVIIEQTVSKYTFRHECDGVVVPVNNETKYCQGKNLLTVSKDNGEWKILQENNVKSASDAFVFGETLITPKNNILLGYYSEPCVIDDSYCGAGMPENNINLVFDTEKMEIRTLKNFPSFIRIENLYWDNSDHAAYTESSCGQVGCDVVPVKIYDLETDFSRIATVYKAVGESWYREENPKTGTFPRDSLKELLPYWSNISWNFKKMKWNVEIHNVGGTTGNITFAWESFPKNQNLDWYVKNYRKFEIILPKDQLFLLDNKEEQNLEKVFRLGMEKCSPDGEEMSWCAKGTEDYISGITFLSDKNWANGKDHEFYIEFGMEGPPLYHGPFYDNVLKLSQEAKLREDFMKIE